MSVFIAAPFEKRIERTMMIEGIAEKEAVSMTKKKDKTRKRYYESRTGKRWGLRKIMTCILTRRKRHSMRLRIRLRRPTS